MSTSVTNAFVRQFSDMMTMLVEQNGSKLAPVMTNRQRLNGEMTYFDRLGSTTAVEMVTRHGGLPPEANIEHSRRRAILRFFHQYAQVDTIDKVRMLIDPTNLYAKRIASALGRTMDDLILAAIYGNAVAVTGGVTTETNVALPASNIIDEDFGTASSDLTIEKLIEARRIMGAANVDFDSEQPILILDTAAELALLANEKVTRIDFNTQKTLVNGRVDEFLGFKFVKCERIATTPHKTSEGFVRAIAVMPSAIGVATGLEVESHIETGTAASAFNTIVYARMGMDAVRLEEARVVSIECYRT